MNGERPQPPGPGLKERLLRSALDRGAGLLSRAESSLPLRCLRRFAAINGRDRSLVLGGQAFTALIPLLIVVAAAASGRGPTALADRLAARSTSPAPRHRPSARSSSVRPAPPGRSPSSALSCCCSPC